MPINTGDGKPDRFWKRLIPRYGNWGGPGWCGGEWQHDPALTDWTVQPVDAMDIAFKAHDFNYQKKIVTRKQADKRLAATLLDTNVRGVWPNIYRAGAIIIFGLRGLFTRSG